MCHVATAWTYFPVALSTSKGCTVHGGYGGMGLVYKLQYQCWVGGLSHLSCLWWGPGWPTWGCWCRGVWPPPGRRAGVTGRGSCWRCGGCRSASRPGGTAFRLCPWMSWISATTTFYIGSEVFWCNVENPVKVHQHTVCCFMAVIIRFFKGCFRLIPLNSCCTVADPNTKVNLAL